MKCFFIPKYKLCDFIAKILIEFYNEMKVEFIIFFPYFMKQAINLSNCRKGTYMQNSYNESNNEI